MEENSVGSLLSILFIASLQTVSTNSISVNQPSVKNKIIVSNDAKNSEHIAADVLFSLVLEDSLEREERISLCSEFTDCKSSALARLDLRCTSITAAKTIPAITLYYEGL